MKKLYRYWLSLKNYLLIMLFLALGIGVLVFIREHFEPTERTFLQNITRILLLAFLMSEAFTTFERLPLDSKFYRLPNWVVFILKMVVFLLVAVVFVALEEIVLLAETKRYSFSAAAEFYFKYGNTHHLAFFTGYMMILFVVYSSYIQMRRFAGNYTLLEVLFDTYVLPKKRVNLIVWGEIADREVVLENPRLAQYAYREIDRIVDSCGGMVETYGATHFVVFWQGEKERRRQQALKFLQGVADTAFKKEGEVLGKYGSILDLRFGIATGQVNIYQVGGFSRMQIIRRGIPIDLAKTLTQADFSRRLRITGPLALFLNQKGYSSETASLPTKDGQELEVQLFSLRQFLRD